MFYKNIKPVKYHDIQRFANIYGFPYDKSLIDIFYAINGCKPTWFKFLYYCEEEPILSSIKQLLSFNPDDRHNMEEGFEVINDNSGDVVPFAIDENDNYLCYYNLNGEEAIKLFCCDNEEYYNIYNTDNELYSLDDFFEDLNQKIIWGEKIEHFIKNIFFI